MTRWLHVWFALLAADECRGFPIQSRAPRTAAKHPRRYIVISWHTAGAAGDRVARAGRGPLCGDSYCAVSRGNSRHEMQCAPSYENSWKTVT